MPNTVCEICEESYDEEARRPVVIFPCGHTYCSDCLNKITNKLCPQCRQSIEQTVTNFSILKQDKKENPIEEEIKKKIENFELIKESFDIILKRMEFKLAEANKKLKENQNKESMLLHLKFHVENEFSFEQEFHDIKILLKDNIVRNGKKIELLDNRVSKKIDIYYSFFKAI